MFYVFVLFGTIIANAIGLNLVDKESTTSYNNVVEKVKKSIVNIDSVKQNVIMQSQLQDLFNDPFFKQFLPKNFDKNYFSQNSTSSGVILSKNGFIITTASSVKNSKKIIVTLWNQKKYNARLIGVDRQTSLAIIKIDTDFLTPIKIAKSDITKVGDVVFAIGNPFGLNNSISKGLISYLDKNHFIQTDATINQSNIGGALVDENGVLIGVSAGISFAIPTKEIKDIIKHISANGDILKGYVGLEIKDLDDNFKNLYTHKNGAIVLDIIKNSPAFLADIKRGDLIFNIDGKNLKNSMQFNKLIDKLNPNDKVTLQLERDHKVFTKTITIGILKQKKSITNSTEILNGLYVDNINLINSTKYRINKNLKGVLIINVKASSKAEKAGFQAGDIIIQIENKEIDSLDDIQAAIIKYENKPKKVFINRYGQVLALLIR